MQSSNLFLNFRFLLFGVCMLVLNGCSTDEVTTLNDPDELLQKENALDLKAFDSWAEQIDYLTKKMRSYHNFQVAGAQGFEFLVYMPNMGDHFAIAERIDDQFNFLEPELLIYIINDDGEREFVGVEYLVASGEGTPPEGFIGEDDVWSYLGGGLWALHAWVGLENPDGVFYSTNSLVTY